MKEIKIKMGDEANNKLKDVLKNTKTLEQYIEGMHNSMQDYFNEDKGVLCIVGPKDFYFDEDDNYEYLKWANMCVEKYRNNELDIPILVPVGFKAKLLTKNGQEWIKTIECDNFLGEYND